MFGFKAVSDVKLPRQSFKLLCPHTSTYPSAECRSSQLGYLHAPASSEVCAAAPISLVNQRLPYSAGFAAMTISGPTLSPLSSFHFTWEASQFGNVFDRQQRQYTPLPLISARSRHEIGSREIT
jgi:hypothetical protein